MSLKANCSIDTAIEEAKQKLGFAVLKEKQIEAVKWFVSHQDTFVCLPTGYVMANL